MHGKQSPFIVKGLNKNKLKILNVINKTTSASLTKLLRVNNKNQIQFIPAIIALEINCWHFQINSFYLTTIQNISGLKKEV